MKVLDLHCTHDHAFEGWFASEDDFNAQLARQLIACPVCGDVAVTRVVSAPRLNLAASKRSDVAEAPPQSPQTRQQQLQALWLRTVRQVMAQSEDVGERFAEEARRIHYSEAPERSIRGTATRDEAAALADEGIEVMSLPVPAGFKDTLQ